LKCWTLSWLKDGKIEVHGLRSHRGLFRYPIMLGELPIYRARASRDGIRILRADPSGRRA
jgi:hypothetical protein